MYGALHVAARRQILLLTIFTVITTAIQTQARPNVHLRGQHHHATRHPRRQHHRLRASLASHSGRPHEDLVPSDDAAGAVAGASLKASTYVCETPTASCMSAVHWAMEYGIHKNLSWYPGLSSKSAFEDFQVFFSRRKDAGCTCKQQAEGSNGVATVKANDSVSTVETKATMSCEAADSDCLGAVRWAMDKGIHSNPSWYPGLTTKSTFIDFQMLLAHSKVSGCKCEISHAEKTQPRVDNRYYAGNRSHRGRRHRGRTHRNRRHWWHKRRKGKNLPQASLVSAGIAVGAEGAKPTATEVDHDTIHLTMLTDRKVGAAAAMESVCRNTAAAKRLLFHIIGPSGYPWHLRFLAPSCAKGGATMKTYSLEEMTARIEKIGFSPVWRWNASRSKKGPFTVHPAEWDNSSTHKDPFNLLRFYLPHIEPFRWLPKVLFMDDDVVILKDVAKAWDFVLRKGAVMSASCHNWVWSDCDRFQSSTSLSYLDVPYLGFGRIGNDRSVINATCKTSRDTECMPLGFMEFLGNVSIAINGPNNAVTLASLGKETAWNYGFNLFDLDTWRKEGITDKYTQWMKLNNRYRVFPETSLAFGLGIAMLAKIGRVHCFDEVTPVFQGLGFVGPIDLKSEGRSQTLRESFGLHFNGPHKPWDPRGGNPYSGIFLEYARDTDKQNFNRALTHQRQLRNERRAKNATSFVLLTDARSGSEWFMELLDQHPEICASGEADDGAMGFPREALLPSRYIHQEQAVDARALSLLSVSHEVIQQVPRNYYTPSAPGSVQPKPNDTSSEDGRFNVKTCQAKASCSWGNMVGLLWRAATHKSMCIGEEEDWRTRSLRLGLGQHLSTVCSLLKRAELNLRGLQGVKDPTSQMLMAEAFQVYFRHQMRESLMLNDVEYDSLRESKRLLPCKCPRTTLIAGQKVMHDWIGDLPTGGKAYASWREQPWSVNYNADLAAASLGAPTYDLIGAMKDVRTRVINFERKNMLARYVSLQAANASNIFHCKEDECVKKAASVSIEVNITSLQRFVEWNTRVHEKNRAMLKKAGLSVLNLYYEDCVVNIETCLDKVADFLNVSKPAGRLATAGKLHRTIENLPSSISNLAEVTNFLQILGLQHWLP